MKTCTSCNKQKPDDQFSFRNKSQNRRSSWCKDCYAKRNQSHYRQNKQAYRKNAIKWKAQHKKEVYTYLFDYFKTHPCIDCGEYDPVVLDFDHKKPVDKVSAISKMVQDSRSIKTIKAEVRKCDVRCANCHRRRTAKEFNWYAML